MFEVPVGRMLGQEATSFWIDPAQREQFLAALGQHGRVDDVEVQLRTANGRTFWCRLSAQRMRFAGEETMLGAMVDITDQKLARERLHELATRDALTGTYNRRYLEELLRTEVERADRYSRPLTVAMIDVDHFKRVNDTYGHPVGDEVLRAIVSRCQKAIRISDALGRYGGEEFVLVLPETALNEARVVAERVRNSVSGALVVVGDRALPITVSIGLASFQNKEKAEALLARADKALYAAKAAGRNRLEVDA
jgi:diguanylate cyclase (GGDEF)-like protein